MREPATWSECSGKSSFERWFSSQGIKVKSRGKPRGELPTERQRLWSWGSGSVGQVPATRAWGLEFDSQQPHKKLDMTTHVCNPNAVEAETGRGMGLAGQPAQSNQNQFVLSKNEKACLKRHVLRNDTQCWLLSSTHAPTHTQRVKEIKESNYGVLGQSRTLFLSNLTLL